MKRKMRPHSVPVFSAMASRALSCSLLQPVRSTDCRHRSRRARSSTAGLVILKHVARLSRRMRWARLATLKQKRWGEAKAELRELVMGRER